MPDCGANGDWTAAVADGEGHSLTARLQAGSVARVIAVRERLGQVMGVLALVLLLAVVVLAAQLWSRRGDGPQPEG
jgi:hypothetical protein